MDGKDIWFKKSFGRYYPINVYGWLSFISILFTFGLIFLVVKNFNRNHHFVDDAALPFLVIIPGLSFLFYVIKKHS